MNKMKRILIFSLVYYPRFIGGAEIAIKEITDRIRPEDIEFHMVTLRLDRALPKYEKIGNVHVHRVGFTSRTAETADSLRFPLYLNKYLLMFTGLYEASLLHSKYKFDAIWSMMATYNSFAALLFKYTHPNVPFILTLQEGDPIEYIKKRVGIFYPLFERIFKKAEQIQAISIYLGEWAKDMGYNKTVEIIPNGVDTAHFEQENKEKIEEIKNTLGKKEGDIFLITTSRLVVKNAVKDVVASLHYLPENVKFIILGQGYEEMSLRKQVVDMGIEERVHFLGYVGHADMPNFLKASDIFIRPSISEGFGNSFIEAMAAGLPVLATPVGGIVDFLFDPEKNPGKPSTGLFVNVEDPQSIATQVKRILEDSNLKNTIVENGRKMVKEKYEWDLVASMMKERVFEKVL